MNKSSEVSRWGFRRGTGLLLLCLACMGSSPQSQEHSQNVVGHFAKGDELTENGTEAGPSLKKMGQEELPPGKKNTGAGALNIDTHIRARIKGICRTFGVELDKGCTVGMAEKAAPGPFPVIRVGAKHGDVFEFDPADGALLTYSPFDPYCNKKTGTKLSGTEAAKRFNEFAKSFGAPMTVTAADGRFMDDSTADGPETSSDAGKWEFQKNYDYNGIEVLGCCMRVEVSVVDGHIMYYSNKPFYGGNIDVLERVSEATATAIAKEYMAVQTHNASTQWETRAQKFILDRNWFGKRTGDAGGESGRYECVWIVAFGSGEGTHACVSVDIKTGEILEKP